VTLDASGPPKLQPRANGQLSEVCIARCIDRVIENRYRIAENTLYIPWIR